MREGPVFDACVSLFYKFVPKRNRRVIRDVQNLEVLLPWERDPFLKVRDSGLLDSDALPQDVTLRAELVSWNNE
eukprot:4258976-Alexandrium_andersonii.AAC.1